MSEFESGSPSFRSPSMAQQVDTVCDQFEAAWKQGTRPRVEDFLSDSTEPDRTELLRELLHLDWTYRQGAGEVPTVDEYRLRFPDHEAVIREVAANSGTIVRPSGEQDSAAASFGSTATKGSRNEGTNKTESRRLPNLPGYEILGVLGQGGMGVVYQARDLRLKRLVAIKMILAGRDAHGDEPERQRFQAEAIARFRTEAEAVARLQHPNIVQVYAIDEHESQPFVVLEFVDGGSLSKRISDTLLPPREAASIVRVLAEAMQAAHDRGIIHRDLKPANVLLTGGGVPKISDFGLAKNLEDDSGQTQIGAVMGTPSYMSPEQAAGRTSEIGPATDTYALGAILYELLTGRPPFKAATVHETVHQVKHDEPVAPRLLNRAIDRDQETIALKCLSKDPSRRYESASALADDLRLFLEQRPIKARPISRVGRLWRWCRRHRAVATLAALAVLLLLAGTTVSTYFGYSAHYNASLSSQSATRYREQKQLAEQRLFDAEMSLAQRLLEKGQLPPALKLLDKPRLAEDGTRLPLDWEWYYLKRQCHSESLNLTGHVGEVDCVAFSPNRLWIASGGRDKTVRLWDRSSGKLLHLFSSEGAITAVGFSSDSTLLAAASTDSSVTLWNIADGAERLIYDSHILNVKSLAFRPNGHELASAGEDGSLRFWDLTGVDRLVVPLPSTERSLSRLEFSADGQVIATVGRLSGLCLRDVTTGKELFRKNALENELTQVALSPDGRIVAVAGVEPTILLWDRSSGASLGELDAHVGEVTGLVFSHDGKLLASSGKSDNAIKIWEVATQTLLRTLRGHTAGVLSLDLSSDGKQVVTGGTEGSVKVWDATNDSAGPMLRGHVAHVSGIAFAPDGRRLVSCSQDYSVRIWDAESGEQLQELGRHTILLEPPRGKLRRGLVGVSTQSGHDNIVRSVAFGPDGEQVASADNRTVRLWNATNGQELSVIDHGGVNVGSLAFLPDGKRLAVSIDAKLVIWDLATKQRTLEIPTGTDTVHVAAIQPGGRMIATAGNDGLIKLSDAETGVEFRTLAGHENHIASLAFSSDGRWLASGSVDSSARLWNPETGEQHMVCRGHSGTVSGVGILPGNRRLVTAGGAFGDEAVKVWDLTTGQDLLTLEGPFTHVAISRGGFLLAASRRNPDAIQVWNSRPIDSNPYRTEPWTPSPGLQPLSDEDFDKSMSLRQLAPKILGTFTATELPREEFKNETGPLRTAPGSVFYVAVVSIPRRLLVPSLDEYKEFNDPRKTRTSAPLPRSRIRVESPSRFQLHSESGKSHTAKIWAEWPLRQAPGFGFFTATRQFWSYVPVDPAKRECYAVGWVLTPSLAEGRHRLQYLDGKPIEIPNPRLEAPRVLVPQISPHQKMLLAARKAKAGDHASAATDVEKLVANAGTDDIQFYNAACVLGIAAASVGSDETLDLEARQRLRQSYLARAVRLLRSAMELGFSDVQLVATDEDLDPLRGLEEFQELIREFPLD